MREETYAYVNRLLVDNRPARELIVSDWTMMNDALARHYGYPGIEGGSALADLIAGEVEPGGRLPFAIPHDTADLVHFDKDATTETYGLLHGQWHLDAEGVAPHFAFGAGCGYTTFEVVGAAWADDRTVRVDVRNTDDPAGRVLTLDR